MSEESKQATLAALMTRGPWSGRDLSIDPAWTLTGAELEAVYDAIDRHDTASIPELLGVLAFSDRKVDRAVQLLRRAGLVSYDKATRLWVLT